MPVKYTQDEHEVENERLLYQLASSKIRELGRRLSVSDKVINTAIIYMHSFHAFHSFTEHLVDTVATAAVFLVCKMCAERFISLMVVIKSAHRCFQPRATPIDVKAEEYQAIKDEVLLYEHHLLMSVGFQFSAAIFPHYYIEDICRFVRAIEDLKKAALLVADMSLALTSIITISVEPIEVKKVACASFHLACKWANYKIDSTFNGKEWFYYIDNSFTWKTIDDVSENLDNILASTPEKYKKRIMDDRFPKEAEERPLPEDEIDEKVKNQKWKLVLIDLPKKVPASKRKRTE